MSFFDIAEEEFLKIASRRFPFLDESRRLLKKRGIRSGAVVVGLSKKRVPKQGSLLKQANVGDSAKRLYEIARHKPELLGTIAKETMSGPGGSVAKGLVYGGAGVAAIRGLGHRNRKTRHREPLNGALRGALLGGSISSLAALVMQYPELRRALLRHS